MPGDLLRHAVISEPLLRRDLDFDERLDQLVVVRIAVGDRHILDDDAAFFHAADGGGDRLLALAEHHGDLGRGVAAVFV